MGLASLRTKTRYGRDIHDMTTAILASLLPRDRGQELSAPDAADIALLEIEKFGSNGVVAVSQGSEQFRPSEMRLLEDLENHGFLRCDLLTMVGATGRSVRATYHLTPLGRM